jgi:hypothetical protein
LFGGACVMSGLEVMSHKWLEHIILEIDFSSSKEHDTLFATFS